VDLEQEVKLLERKNELLAEQADLLENIAEIYKMLNANKVSPYSWTSPATPCSPPVNPGIPLPYKPFEWSGYDPTITDGGFPPYPYRHDSDMFRIHPQDITYQEFKQALSQSPLTCQPAVPSTITTSFASFHPPTSQEDEAFRDAETMNRYRNLGKLMAEAEEDQGE
jgi:hypothetical protein